MCLNIIMSSKALIWYSVGVADEGGGAKIGFPDTVYFGKILNHIGLKNGYLKTLDKISVL